MAKDNEKQKSTGTGWKRVQIRTGKILYRDPNGMLHVGVEPDEMIVPDSVFLRHFSRLTLLEDNFPAPYFPPILTEQVNRDDMVRDRIRRQRQNQREAAAARAERQAKLVAQARGR